MTAAINPEVYELQQSGFCCFKVMEGTVHTEELGSCYESFMSTAVFLI